MQQIRNLTGLTAAELRSLRKKIGHVPERGNGVRMAMNRIEFFRAWFDFRAKEDEHAERRRIALADRAENNAELSRLDLRVRKGELISVGEAMEEMKETASIIREALEVVIDCYPGSGEIIDEAFDKVDKAIE